MFSILEIIDMAIQLEKNGEQVYRRGAGQVADDELKRMLLWFADEEVRHAQFFTALKTEIEENAGDLINADMSRELIDRFIREQMFSLKDVDFTRIDDLEELLNIFIEFEEDTLQFFAMLKPFVNDSNEAGRIDQIIAEEKSHISQLREIKGQSRPALLIDHRPQAAG
jgi:rubrerythrin